MKRQINLNSNIIGPSREYPVLQNGQVPLDPAYYKGSFVYGEDGFMRFSNGVEWRLFETQLEDEAWFGTVDLNDLNITGSDFVRKLKLLRGDQQFIDGRTGLEGELAVNLDKSTVVVYDGSTQGGIELVNELGEQTLSNKTLNLADSTITGLDGAGLTVSGGQLNVDNTVVRTSGNQTISGTKTFSDDIVTTGISSTENEVGLFESGVTKVNFATNSGFNISIGSSNGQTTVNHTLNVLGDLEVQGELRVTTEEAILLDDKILVLLDVENPTDVLANEGGIELNGDTLKEFKWINATQSWTSSENLDIAAGKTYRIDGSTVLSATTLASSVVDSSLKSVGTLESGTWEADVIGVEYGGTGQSLTFTNGQLLIGNSSGNTLSKSTLTAGTGIGIANGEGSITITNNDRGTAQNIFKNIADEDGNDGFSATTNDDTIRIEGQSPINVDFDPDNKKIIISSDLPPLTGGEGIIFDDGEIKVNTDEVVTIDGTQTITGAKTFTQTISGSINGNAATANKLSTPININDVEFDGSDDIIIYSTLENSISFSNGLTVASFDGSSAVSIENTDRGSDQNIFKNIANSEGAEQITADSNNDTIRIAATGAASVSFDSNTNTITISSTDTDTQFTPGDGLEAVGTEFSVDDTVVRTSGTQSISGTKTFVNTIVAEEGLEGDVTGNADTATALETARTINGVSFNGTQNITLPGTDLSVTSGTTSGPTINSSTGTDATIPTASATASGVVTTGAQTFAGTKTFNNVISGSISGNAGTATALETPRAINGVFFDGTENISIDVGAGPSIQSERTVTGTSYTLQAGDADGIIFFTSNSPITVTIPTNANVSFEQRTTIVLVQQGDGIITVNGASGVAVEGGNISLNKFSALTLYRRETDNQWFVVGGRD